MALFHGLVVKRLTNFEGTWVSLLLNSSCMFEDRGYK